MKIARIVVGLLASLLTATHSDAQSVLYGATASNQPGQLVILNKATGALVSAVGPTNDSVGTNYGITGLAYNPTSGILYGSTANGSSYNASTRANLVTINLASGLVTVIGAFNVGNSGNPSTMSDLAPAVSCTVSDRSGDRTSTRSTRQLERRRSSVVLG
jgi:hypothetical protein